MRQQRRELIRALFDDYIEMYASRDDRLTERFSQNFSGYAGASDSLVKDRDEWIKVTRQDFTQVTGRIRIEMVDLSMQDLCEDVVLVTAFFHIHLPVPDPILSQETARLVLVFRLEGDDWKIAHSGISIPFGLAHEGEVYPMDSLSERNRQLEVLVRERTQALEEANEKLDAMSNTDGLTGIANRRNFDHMLAQEWDRAQRAGTPLALIMLDVDLFKHYNDHYGHVAGDDCLQALAKAMTHAGRRAGELVARYGGEEFVVLLPNTNEAEALESAYHIQRALQTLALRHEGVVTGYITVSMGISSVTPSMQYVSQYLVRMADLALYSAKHSGRNCVRLATV